MNKIYFVKLNLFRYDQHNFKPAVFAMVYYNFSIMSLYNLIYDKQPQTVSLLGSIRITDHIMWYVVQPANLLV